MTWTQPTLNGIIPSERGGCTCTAVGSEIYLFGGHSYDKKTGWSCYNDIFVFNVNTMTWSQASLAENPPLPRTSHTAVSFDSEVLIFGGNSYTDNSWTPLNDLH